jgi:hypothetical protein
MKLLSSGIDEISRIEQDRRTLQDGIDRTQRVIEQTLTLIEETQATRVRAHVWAMLFRLKPRTRTSMRDAAYSN